MKRSISEIKKICVKEETYDSVIIRITRKITPYITWVLLRLGLSANKTTILGMFVGTTGAVLLSINRPFTLICGLFLLQLSNMLDYCDGEIARYNNYYSKEKMYDISGAYLDWLWHFYIPTTTIFFLSLGLFSLTNAPHVFIIGFISILGFCIFPFTCKEHILIDQLRKYPDIINNNDFKIAMMDHPQIVSDESVNKNRKMAFVLKQVSEWVYYPSFFNALSLIVLADIIMESYYFRYGYLIVLTFIILLHQLKKIKQTFMVLKKIKYDKKYN